MMLTRHYRWWLPLAIVCVILVGSLVPMKNFLPVHLVGEITNTLHYPSGILLGLLLVPMVKHSPRLLLIAWSVGVVLFGSIELIQPLFGRACTLADWLQSSAGLTLGLISSRMDAAAPAPMKRLYIMVGTAMLIAFSVPLFEKIQLLDAAEQRYPLIADFESEDDLRLWRTSQQITATLETQGSRFADLAEQFPEIALQNSRYARIAFPDNQVPAITYFPVVKDWRGYRKLCFDSRADRAGQPVTVKLSDNVDHAFRASWQQVFPNPVLWRTMCIELQTIKRQSGEPFDLSRVQALVFMGPESTSAGWFDLDSVRLVK